jgi:hypothetical protein
MCVCVVWRLSETCACGAGAAPAQCVRACACACVSVLSPPPPRLVLFEREHALPAARVADEEHLAEGALAHLALHHEAGQRVARHGSGRHDVSSIVVGVRNTPAHWRGSGRRCRRAPSPRRGRARRRHAGGERAEGADDAPREGAPSVGAPSCAACTLHKRASFSQRSKHAAHTHATHATSDACTLSAHAADATRAQTRKRFSPPLPGKPRLPLGLRCACARCSSQQKAAPALPSLLAAAARDARRAAPLHRSR